MEHEKSNSKLTLVYLKFRDRQKVDFYHWMPELEKWIHDHQALVSGLCVSNEDGIEFNLKDHPTSHNEAEIYITSGDYHYVVIIEKADINTVELNDIPSWDRKDKKLI